MKVQLFLKSSLGYGPSWLSGALRGLTAFVCLLAAGLISPGGPVLLRVISPEPGQRVGAEGLEVMVRIPVDGRVEGDSLRVWLNGADVTEDLATASNGCWGRLHGLLDGENVLRVEVEGPSYWLDGRKRREGREVRVLVRRPTDWDRG